MQILVKFSAFVLAIGVIDAASAQNGMQATFGSHSGQRLGTWVAGGGDMNGDGFDEILASAAGENTLGAVHVYSGKDGSDLYTLVVPAGHLASAGDVDGDGVPDLIVGALYERLPLEHTGSALVYSGADGSLIHVFYGFDTASKFGWRVDGVGDVDGDHHDDFIIAALAESGGGLERGSARVFSGIDGALLYTYLGSVDHENLGFAVAGVGDVDADGRPDFAIGSRLYSAGPGSKGKVSVHSGRTGALLLELFGSPQSNGIGVSICGAGDVDDDGYADLLLGAVEDYGAANSAEGRAAIYSGKSGAILQRFSGNATTGNDGFGFSVARLGDVDLDGKPDVAVGTADARYVKVFSTATGALIYEYWDYSHADSGLQPLLAISGVRDMNGDGRAELVVGIRNDSTNVQDGGAVKIYTGASEAQLGTSFCFGDGGGPACPCGNLGATDEGCSNSTGAGATLAAFGSTSVAQNTLFLEGAQLPANTLAVLFAGTQANGGAFHGDGIACLGGSVRRIALRTSDANGAVSFGPGLLNYGSGAGNDGDWNAGDARWFQAFYRNASGPCGSGLNTSAGVALVFTP